MWLSPRPSLQPTPTARLPRPLHQKRSPKGRRDLLSSDLPRFLVDIRDPKLEETAKHIGWDESPQLLYRRGRFAVLVKRTAKYEVPGKDGPTVLGVPVPETLFPRGLLHSSVVAYVLVQKVQKFGLGVPHYRLEQHVRDQGRRARPRHDESVRRRGGWLARRIHRARDVARLNPQRLGHFDRRYRSDGPA